MNENIDLTKILKDCPKGWKFHSSIYGSVTFYKIENGAHYPIIFSFINKNNTERNSSVTEQGLSEYYCNGECTFFPSREQRDWSKFTAPWLKKERFDHKTLKALDKILLRDECGRWHCGSFSHINKDGNYKFGCFELKYKYYIPYNDETRYLIGTTNEAPEFYRYWEE